MSRKGLNVLTDPWIPLAGQHEPATFIELMCGERDADDLDWPRDDFKVFTRLLLSALVQALMPAKDIDELAERINAPMNRKDVLRRIEAVEGDFELLPEKGAGFLQSVKPSPKVAKTTRAGKERKEEKPKGASRFVFSSGDIFLAAVRPDAVSLPVAAVTLFAEQTFAGGGGSGHKPGPGGQPGVLTLIDLGSIRASVWANTLAEALDSKPKSKVTPQPWSNANREERNRGSIGLAEGLFFQPRAIWLTELSRICSLTGATMDSVALEGFQPKHSAAKDGLWIHPCAPMQSKSTGLAPLRLSPGQPAWTGLAQLLQPLARQAKRAKDPNEGPALVLQQWWKLRTRPASTLLVLDYPGRDKAKLGSVLYERFLLSEALDRSKDELHALTRDAEEIARLLRQALAQAHDDQKRGGFASADAVSQFWRETEPAFLGWLEVVGAVDAEDVAVERADQLARADARSSAVRIFDEHVSLSEWNIGKQDRIAKARNRLLRALYGKASKAKQEVRA